MTTLNWNFPSNNGVEELGLHSSLIETFNDTPIKSLAREIVQNSLDAALDGKRAVVEFKSFSIPRSEFPDIEGFEDVLTKCQAFARNDKTKNFFANAIKMVADNSINCLRISDFNTKGLCGSDKDRGTDWTNLVKATGSSDKQGEKGGSFGIGKGAPFACSALRTVFYSTYDINGLKASQGVARLTSFKLGTHADGVDNIAQGTGYWGIEEPHRILPNTEMINLDSTFQRTETGTDIYIAGLRQEIFSDLNELQVTIINEVLNGFIIAIWQDKLEVRVNSFVINKETLPQIIDTFKDRLLSTIVMSYELLANEKTVWETIDVTMSNIKIGAINLAVSLRHDGNNRISMIRSTGMKILDKDKLCSTLRFYGIGIIEGKQLNEWLIKLENPAHNNWGPERYSPKESRKLLNSMYDSIKDKLQSIAEKTFSSVSDIEGAGDFIPDNDKEEGEKQKATDKKEEATSKIVSTDKKIIKKATSNTHMQSQLEGEDINHEVDAEGDPIEGSGSEGYIHTGGTSKPGEKKKDPMDVLFVPGTEFGGKKLVPVQAKKLRMFCINRQEQTYRIVFTPDESAKKAYLVLNKVAELSEKEPVEIKKVLNNTSSIIKKNTIGYYELVEGETIRIDVQISETGYCSMEVKIYAYKG